MVVAIYRLSPLGRCLAILLSDSALLDEIIQPALTVVRDGFIDLYEVQELLRISTFNNWCWLDWPCHWATLLFFIVSESGNLVNHKSRHPPADRNIP